MRKSHNSAAAAVAALVLFAAAAGAQPPNPYRTIAGLVQPPAGRVLGSMSMVDVAKDGSLWIAERCGENNCLGHDTIAPIIHTDANGKWLTAFGAGKFAWPHAIYVDPDGNLWVTDARAGEGRGHQVIKFASDGGELMRLGVAGEAGDDNAHFNGPTDVVVGLNGRAALPGVSRCARSGGPAAAEVRAGGVRGVSEVRAIRARFPAPALRALPCREARRVQLQGPRFLPELRCAADGRVRGTLGR
jgi:hypothetical protein